MYRLDVGNDLARNMNRDFSRICRKTDRPRPGVMRSLRNLLVAFVLMVPFTAQQAKSELAQRIELMVDETAALDVDAAANAQFRPVARTMTLGYTASAIWLRVWIDPAPDGGEVVVIVRPPMLDSVKFYAPTLAGQDSTALSVTAPRYQLVEPKWPSSLRGYRIAPPEGGAEYFVRIASTGSIAANITATAASAAVRINLITDFVQISYFAFMLVLLLWSLRMLALTKEHLFGWFAAMQAAWLFHNIVSFGYAAVLTPMVAQETLTLAFRTLVIVGSMLSVTFHRAVLIRFRPAAVAVRLLDLQLLGMFIAFILFWTFDRQIALKLNAYGIAATPFILMLNALTARTEASPGLATTRVIYALLSATLMIWVLSLIGIGKISLLSLYGFMIHGLTTGILMFTILHLHVRNLFAAAHEVETQIAAIDHQRAIQQERNRTLAQFIDMMTHETRNALAVINMSVSHPTISDRQRGRVTDAILGLTGVIDRCNQTIRLDSDNEVISTETCDLADILRRLCDDETERVQLCVRAEGPLLLQSDPVLLGVVFSNLIDNALKYSPSSSVVTVALDKSPDGLSVLVENEQGKYGCPDPGQIYRKYYRNQLANAKIGSGLGLYIVRGLLGNLGGQIAYEPTPGHVRFRVWMPC